MANTLVLFLGCPGDRLSSMMFFVDFLGILANTAMVPGPKIMLQAFFHIHSNYSFVTYSNIYRNLR